MKIITATIAVVLFGSALVISQNRQPGQSPQSEFTPSEFTPSEFTPSELIARATADSHDVIRAAGRIEGLTDQVELRARIVEQIQSIQVSGGTWVQKGDILVQLDTERLAQERDLAAALLAMEQAKKERLENGFRPTEIDTARQEYQAVIAKLEAAQKAHDRGKKLAENHAISRENVDNLHADVASLSATAAAAKSRLETLELPPRGDDLLAASAAVRAAEARLQIAQINVDRSIITAPANGQVLMINGEVGELTGPQSTSPLVVMSDTSRLRTVAEIDEFDALRIKTGQSCEIRSDAADGILASGVTVEVEPYMNPKRLYGQWAGERSDTYSRRVWIELEKGVDLPVGLPVDVYIQVE